MLVVAPALLALAGPAACQDPLPPLDEYHVRVFTVADGLPGSDVIDIVQGEDGHIYVAGGRGLVRFDGYGFQSVPLEGFASAFLRKLQVGPEGRLWILSRENDVGVLDRDRVRVLPPPPGPVVGLPHTTSGPAWLGTGAGLVRVDPAAESSYRVFTTADGLPADSVSGVVELSGGERVVVTPSRLVSIHEGPGGAVRFEPFGPRLDLRLGLLGMGSSVDRAGLWLHTANGVVRYDGTSFEHRRGDQPISLDDVDGPEIGRDVLYGIAGWMNVLEAAEVPEPARIRRLLADQNGNRWLVVASDDLLQYAVLRGRNGSFEPIDLGAHLEHSSVGPLVEDHEGSIWIGTDRGLIQLAPQRVAVLTREHGLAHTFTTAMLQDSTGALWIGTWGGGLHRFSDGGLERRVTTRDGLPHDRVRSLYQSRSGDLWVGTARGFGRVTGEGVADMHGTPSVTRAFAETADSAGGWWLWVAAGRDLLVGEGGRFRTFRPDVEWGSEIWALEAANDGALWAGGRGGLFRIVGDSVQRFGQEHGLRGTHVSSIHEEGDGTLWIGTYEHGLHRYRGNRFVPVTTRQGLLRDGIWRMLSDHEGFVWMSSDGGIFRVERARLHEVADAVEREPDTDIVLEPLVFTEAQGLPTRESNRANPGGWRLTDGRLVFNNIDGAVVIDPERATRPPPPPRTHIRRVLADGTELPARPAEPVRLAAGVRHVSFEFAALSFATPEQNRYRYRLDGYDQDWMDVEGQRRATYTGLEPGRYTLRVQGATGVGPWSQMEARYAFVMPPFVWQTWWFRGLLVAAAVTVLLLVHRARVARLVEVERLRSRIANDLHDDVGSSLSSIALLSEMLRDGGSARELERQQLARISEAAGETMGALREIIWLVDPLHDNTTDLVQRMRKTAQERLDTLSVEFAPKTFSERRPLAPSFVRQVFLIYKEALHNVVRHSGADRVRIDVSAKPDRFILTIEDDGVGFHEDRVELGYGLESMRARAREIGGEIAIECPEGGGTRVTFQCQIA